MNVTNDERMNKIVRLRVNENMKMKKNVGMNVSMNT